MNNSVWFCMFEYVFLLLVLVLFPKKVSITIYVIELLPVCNTPAFLCAGHTSSQLNVVECDCACVGPSWQCASSSQLQTQVQPVTLLMYLIMCSFYSTASFSFCNVSPSVSPWLTYAEGFLPPQTTHTHASNSPAAWNKCHLLSKPVRLPSAKTVQWQKAWGQRRGTHGQRQSVEGPNWFSELHIVSTYSAMSLGIIFNLQFQ